MLKSRLKVLLAENDMTQSKLSEITNIRPGTITNIVKARNTRSTLNNDKLYALQHQPFTIRSSGRLFSSLEDLVNETSKGNQQDTYLD